MKEKKLKIDKKRYMSVLIILSVILPAIFITAYAGSIGVYIGSVFYMIVGMYAIWETYTALGFNKYTSLIPALSIVAFFLVPYSSFKNIEFFSANFDVKFHVGAIIKEAIQWKSFIIVAAASLIPVFVEPHIAKAKMGYPGMILVALFITLITSFFMKSLWASNAGQMNPILFMVLVPIFADSFGYFGGKYLGNILFKGKKLAPKLSPKKTWAGAVIGFIASFTFAVLFGYYNHLWIEIKINELAMSFIMAIVLSIISPIGDLVFSAIKRKQGIKDFSNILPGHGGIFDRLDSTSFVIALTSIIYIMAI